MSKLFNDCDFLGYGNFAARTFSGRLFCLLFGIIGIPFMLCVLTDVGGIMAGLLQVIWPPPSSSSWNFRVLSDVVSIIAGLVSTIVLTTIISGFFLCVLCNCMLAPVCLSPHQHPNHHCPKNHYCQPHLIRLPGETTRTNCENGRNRYNHQLSNIFRSRKWIIFTWY